MTILSQLPVGPQIIPLDDTHFAEIDRAYGLVSICEGQRLGLDNDWGGKAVAKISIAHLNTLFEVFSMFQQPVAFYYDATLPAKQREDWVGA